MSQYLKPIRANLTVSWENIQCEGLGCNRKAIAEVEVNAGKFGIIILNLCKDCEIKFE
jgi:hypothetical protein